MKVLEKVEKNYRQLLSTTDKEALKTEHLTQEGQNFTKSSLKSDCHPSDVLGWRPGVDSCPEIFCDAGLDCSLNRQVFTTGKTLELKWELSVKLYFNSFI